jgi:hypothetical protein
MPSCFWVAADVPVGLRDADRCETAELETKLDGDVAQLGERRVRNAKVEGSNPFVSISYNSRRPRDFG